MDIQVYDRASSTVYLENQFKQKQANFLYNKAVGRILLKLFIATRTFSRLNAVANSGKKSIKKIKPFIEKYNIDLSDFPAKEYRSFNDFFTRKLLPGKRPFSDSNDALIAVADSKLSIYKIDENLNIAIKNGVYTINELTGDTNISSDYAGGVCLVFRLTVDDYHRYCFFDSGKVISRKSINGYLHTVGPLSSKRYKVLSENHRVVTMLKTDHFGESLYIEVGALLVGKIINHKVLEFAKGDEKGYFALGGSTVVVLLHKDIVKIDDDILEYAKQAIEIKVKMGEKIGVRYA